MADIFDVAVVGRGLWGTACARHLAENGCRVALIGPDEPHDPKAHTGPFGSFHDAGRITRRLATDPVWAELAGRSIDRYVQIEADSGIDFYTPCGGMMAGPGAGPATAFTEAFLATAQALGLQQADLGRQSLAHAAPMFRFAPGTRAALDSDGGVIDPRAMRRAQEVLAQRVGATIVHQPVMTRSDRTLTLDDGSTLSAGHIVLATGAYAHAVPLSPKRPAMRVYARTVAFAEVSPEQADRLSDMPSLIFVPDGQTHDLYLLPPIRYPDGRFYLKIGGEDQSPLLATGDGLNAWFRTAGNAIVGESLLGALRDVMPGVSILGTRTGSCAVAFTATGYPYIETVTPGLTLLAGGNGAGAKCADEIGRLGARLAMGHDLRAEALGVSFGTRWAGDSPV